MKPIITALALLVVSSLALSAEEESRTWKGTWTNKRYNTNGTLECVAKPGKDGEWTATFSGVFQGRPFKYDVKFDEKAGKGQSALSGKAEIQNQKYDWTGAIKGDTMTGQYRSNAGWYGDFTMKETKKEAAKKK